MIHQPRKFFKFIALLLSFCFIFEQTGFSQVAASLDISGHLSALQQSLAARKFRPLHLRYLQYLPSNNSFNLLLDKGTINATTKDLESVSKDLLKYFFIGLTLPNDAFWVNLRPDSPDNIIDGELAKTDIGRILLEADLELKKDTARATSPETPEGKAYWDKLYQKAGELFGNGNVTIPTLTRPWIVPDEIIIRETNDSAYVYKATLKVMLESDYLSSQSSAVSFQQYTFKDPKLKELNEYSSQLIKELIIPKLTREINNSKKYAGLRQVYYSLILAQWFKARFRSQNTPYSQLIDRHELTSLTASQSYSKDTYFQAYQKSFKDGEYNLNESAQTPFGQTVRSYFSGGFQAGTLVPPAMGTSAVTLGGGTTTRIASQDNVVPKGNPYLAAAEGEINLGELVVRISDRELSPEEIEERVRAIENAHRVEPERQLGERNADGTYERYSGNDEAEKAYTYAGIAEKARILREGGFDRQQRRLLVKYGLAGNKGSSIVKELAAEPQRLEELKTKYRQLHREIVAQVARQHQDQGAADFSFTKDYSLGAQGAVKLKIFELLAKGFSEQDIIGFITRDFLPSLKEEQMGALLPVGTEVEIWNKAPYTDPAFYPRSTAVEIWENILGLPFGRDELVEFALPPSLSGNSQVAMIDSMVELGLIPQGWFSLHISGALPLQANHQHLLDQLASYLEMTKAILYTSDERIDYFADRWNPLDVKGGAGNVSKTQGKKPAFAIYDDTDEVTRLEYRSGDVVVPGRTYQGAIPFIQNTHSLMFLALVAAIDSGAIKNKFMEDLLVAFDTFINDIDAWAELIKDTHPQLKALFGGNLFTNVRAIKEIIQLRKTSPELIEALGVIVLSLQERLRVILTNAQRTQDLPADIDRIDNLEIIKRLRRGIPKIEDLKDIFMNLPMRNIDFGGLIARSSNFNSPSGATGPSGNDYRDDISRWINEPRNFYNISPISRDSYYIKPTSFDFTRFEIPQINLQLSNFRINPEELIFIPRQPQGFLARLWAKAQAVLIAVHNWLIPLLVPLFPGIDLFQGLFTRKGIPTKFQKKFWDALNDNRRVAKQNNFDMDSPVARRGLVNQALRDILSGLPTDKMESLRQDFWKAVDLIMRLPKSVSQKQAFNFALNIIDWKMRNPPGSSPSISSTGFGNEEEANRNILNGIRAIAARQGLSMPADGDVDLGVDNQDVFMVNGTKVIVIDAPYLSVGEEGEEQVASAGLRRGTIYVTRTEFQRWQAEGIVEQKVKHEQDEVEFLRDKAKEIYGSDEALAFEMMSRFLKNRKNATEARAMMKEAHGYAAAREGQNIDLARGREEIAGDRLAYVEDLVLHLRKMQDEDLARARGENLRQEQIEKNQKVAKLTGQETFRELRAAVSGLLSDGNLELGVIDNFYWMRVGDIICTPEKDGILIFLDVVSAATPESYAYAYLSLDLNTNSPSKIRIISVSEMKGLEARYKQIKPKVKVAESQQESPVASDAVRQELVKEAKDEVMKGLTAQEKLAIASVGARVLMQRYTDNAVGNRLFYLFMDINKKYNLNKAEYEQLYKAIEDEAMSANNLTPTSRSHYWMGEVVEDVEVAPGNDGNERIIKAQVLTSGHRYLYDIYSDGRVKIWDAKSREEKDKIPYSSRWAMANDPEIIKLLDVLLISDAMQEELIVNYEIWKGFSELDGIPEKWRRLAGTSLSPAEKGNVEEEHSGDLDNTRASVREMLEGGLGTDDDTATGRRKESASGRSAFGGIDLRSLPIVTQAVSNLRAQLGVSGMGNLQRINLSEEWDQIERMVSGGITPSAERIKEFVQAACAQGVAERDIEKVVSCISDILRQQEESCCETEATLKDILVVLEAADSEAELSKIFIGVKA